MSHQNNNSSILNLPWSSIIVFNFCVWCINHQFWLLILSKISITANIFLHTQKCCEFQTFHILIVVFRIMTFLNKIYCLLTPEHLYTKKSSLWLSFKRLFQNLPRYLRVCISLLLLHLVWIAENNAKRTQHYWFKKVVVLQSINQCKQTKNFFSFKLFSKSLIYKMN